MDDLERFFAFWFGPPRRGYGETPGALKRLQLPDPLRRLHAFAGRWPAREPFPDGTERRALAIQDSLVPASRLKKLEDGKVVFLHENQGVWSCGTRPEGSDPPVWVAGELNEDVGYGGKWGLVDRSLSRFLVTFCLQEMVCGSRFCATDSDLGVEVDELLADGVRIWDDHPYVYASRGYTFHLLDGPLLVGRMRDIWFFGTNHPGGIEPLIPSKARGRAAIRVRSSSRGQRRG